MRGTPYSNGPARDWCSGVRGVGVCREEGSAGVRGLNLPFSTKTTKHFGLRTKKWGQNWRESVVVGVSGSGCEGECEWRVGVK